MNVENSFQTDLPSKKVLKLKGSDLRCNLNAYRDKEHK